MENIIINGLTKIDNMRFTDIEGGFGEGKKAILVKDIANIHGKALKHINEAINKNKNRFKQGTDIIDLKTYPDVKVDLVDLNIMTRKQISNSNNIYLLSERGYAKLLKILEDGIAWEQYDKLVDEYFNMRCKYSYNNPDVNKLMETVDKLVQVVENQTKQQAKNNVVENENPYLHCSMCQSEKSAWKIKQFDKIKDLAKQYDKSEQDTQKAILCSIYNAMSYKDKIDFDIEQSNYNKAFFTFDKQAKITLIAGNNNLREIFEYRIDKIQDILSDKSKNYSYKVDSCEDMADVQAIIDWLK